MVVKPAEIKYLLKYVNQYLNVKLTPKDVQSAFAGMRPLVSSKSKVNTKKLIRDHEVEVDEVSGLVSVLGGKWTTYRAMAEDGINHAQRAIAGRRVACKTPDFLLTGAQGFTPDYWRQLAASLTTGNRSTPRAEIWHGFAQGAGIGKTGAATSATAD
jgi:glycerol-3-phosphate dehydrogenase